MEIKIYMKLICNFGITFGLFLVPSSVFATQSSLSSNYQQWYTGSLLSPSGALRQGGVTIEPYISYNRPIDSVDAFGHKGPIYGGTQSIVNTTLVKYGITNHLSVQLHPQFFYKWRSTYGNGGGQPRVGDLPLDFIWRFVDPNESRLIPAVMLQSGISFPTGRYDHLNSDKTNAGGNGNYVFRAALVTQSTYRIAGHALRVRGWANIRKSVRDAEIHGISTYEPVKILLVMRKPARVPRAVFPLNMVSINVGFWPVTLPVIGLMVPRSRVIIMPLIMLKRKGRDPVLGWLPRLSNITGQLAMV
uniref:Uncharacterized protein n=1 Tax=Zymomonas mobilis TaxID=542 RepID=Q8GM49_ZYMMB|nr:putative protein [Zymomonas mobilis subsp. mobilis str. CP4 = NRRL B-14023]